MAKAEHRGAAASRPHGRRREEAGLGGDRRPDGGRYSPKEVSLAFRIGGRIIERTVGSGDRVTPDQVVAKLDPQKRNERADPFGEWRSPPRRAGWFRPQIISSDRGNAAAAGWTTRVNFDQAQQALRTAKAAVDDAKAQVEIAEGPRQLYAIESRRCRYDHARHRPPRPARSSDPRTGRLYGRARQRMGRGFRRAGAGACCTGAAGRRHFAGSER